MIIYELFNLKNLLEVFAKKVKKNCGHSYRLCKVCHYQVARHRCKKSRAGPSSASALIDVVERTRHQMAAGPQRPRMHSRITHCHSDYICVTMPCLDISSFTHRY